MTTEPAKPVEPVRESARRFNAAMERVREAAAVLAQPIQVTPPTPTPQPAGRGPLSFINTPS